jgi:poly-gamma-glutamate synthesis protein (capsule biosynthesis protein)
VNLNSQAGSGCGPIELLLAGDVCLGEHFFNCGSGLFSRALAGESVEPLDGIKSEVDGADLFLFNLESPVSISGLKENDIFSRCFRGHPTILKSFRFASHNVASVANNHLMQHGVDVALDTLDNLANNNLGVAGLKDPGNSFLCQPHTHTVHGKRITFLSWSQVDEQHVSQEDAVYAHDFNDESLQQVSEEAGKADCLIVSLHAGLECAFSQPQLTELLRSIADAGADLVVVHHSHVFHRIELWHGSLIFYGLGDFIFDLLWDQRLTFSYLVAVLIGDGIESLKLIPVRLGKMGIPVVIDNPQSFALKAMEHGQVVFPGRKSRICHIPISIAKVGYFFKNLPHGRKDLKISFLKHKLLEKLFGKGLL